LQVDRLDDLMVLHQSFVTKEPVNVHCMCRTLLLKYALASALSSIRRNAVWSIHRVNHYFVGKIRYTYQTSVNANHSSLLSSVLCHLKWDDVRPGEIVPFQVT